MLSDGSIFTKLSSFFLYALAVVGGPECQDWQLIGRIYPISHL